MYAVGKNALSTHGSVINELVVCPHSIPVIYIEILLFRN